MSEVLAFRRELTAHPDFHPGMNEVTDLRSARMLLTHEERTALASSDPIAEGARRAILVGDDAHFGIMRAYSALSDVEDFDFRPFRSLEDACAWLGVTVEALPEAIRTAGM